MFVGHVGPTISTFYDSQVVLGVANVHVDAIEL